MLKIAQRLVKAKLKIVGQGIDMRFLKCVNVLKIEVCVFYVMRKITRVKIDRCEHVNKWKSNA